MKTIPQNYKLEFIPDFKNFVFDGVAEITITCIQPTYTIRLDIEDITIESCSCNIDGIEVQPTYAINDGQLVINTHHIINDGCTLTIKYKGVLNDKLIGFYKSSYKVGNKTKYLATSQFEAADARRAFPCFDRPDLKATFDISIFAPKGMTAISNMPVEYTDDSNNGQMFVFKTTPKMSTYLVYLGVGEFEYLNGNCRVRVVTTAGKSEHGKFALELTERLIPLYEQYFAKFYQLPKLDLIALPDFGSGAMENWGAITFRENLLLYDEANSSSSTKQLVAEVVSHELAHQWFGNLVTMKWWNDLWLNESFATFMATKTLDWLYPTWNLWDQFVNSSSNTAMEMDSLPSTHPIDVKVRSPAQIREIFDAISYEKGGSLLRMIEDYVGKITFRDGLRLYIRDFQFQNATGLDLWDSIDRSVQNSIKGGISKRGQRDITDVSVRKIMEPWLNISGFPMVHVTQEQGMVKLTQHPFRAHKQPTKSDTWPIPIIIKSKYTNNRFLMEADTEEIRLSGKFIVNPKRMGFYRVLYQGDVLANIKKSIQRKTIVSMDRWSIQNDLFAMCMVGKASILDYLDLVDAYTDERQYMPLINVGENLSLLLKMSHMQDWNTKIHDVSTPIFEGMLNWLGWKPQQNESHTDSFLRAMAIMSMGRLDREVSTKTADMFDAYIDDPSTVHPDIRSPMFAAVARHGNLRIHSKLSRLFTNTDSAEEQMRIVVGLCEFNTPDILRRTLDFSISNKVRPQNVHSFIIHTASNPNSRGLLWPWLRDNWDAVSSKVGIESGLLGRIVSGLALATDGSEYKEMDAFFKQRDIDSIDRAVRHLLDLTKLYSNFRRRAAQDISH